MKNKEKKDEYQIKLEKSKDGATDFITIIKENQAKRR